jgi:uncharacterized protein (TIGR03437 family)
MRILRLCAAFSLAVCLLPAQMPGLVEADVRQPSASEVDPGTIEAIVNAASFAPGPFAPGTLISIRGSSLSETSVSALDDGRHALPRTLGGVEAVWNGESLPLLSVSPLEVRAQLPYRASPGSSSALYLRTAHIDGSVTLTNAEMIKITLANPGLFAFGGSDEPRPGLVVHAGVDGEAGAPVTRDNPAHPGQVIEIWAAGLGAVASNEQRPAPEMGVPFAGPDANVMAPIEASVAGRAAPVLSAILPAASIGVYQIRVLLPADLPSNNKTQLYVVQNGFASNTITLPVIR